MNRKARTTAGGGKKPSTTRKNGSNGSSFDPNKYMLKLPKNKKVQLPNGRVRWEKIETDYLPVAPRIAWFRKEHPDWSIVTKAVFFANFSGWSGTKCETCERETTNAQYAYSMRVFKKPLCRSCQGLEKFSTKA